MKCNEIQQHLYEHLGESQLPEQIEAHLRSCDECRFAWNELQQLGQSIAGEESFYPETEELEALAAEVDRRIDAADRETKSTVRIWGRYLLPVAASILLLFGVTRMAQWFGGAEVGQPVDDSLYTTVEQISSEEFDDQTVDLLLQDFARDPAVEPGEWLLEDITEDELEYLKNSIDVGEWL